jgi:GlpG protein
MAVRVLVADRHIDLSPLTQQLWAERIPHRVIIEQGQQHLLLADADDAERVKLWLQQWQDGELQQAKPAHDARPWQWLLQLTSTPLSSVGLLLLWLVYVWMQLSDAWQPWLSTAVEAWPQQRWALATYLEMGLWPLWRPAILHFSLLHIVMNSFWWWILARRIERLDGGWALLALVFASGLVGNVVQWWYAGPAFGGASGITLALLGWVGWRQKRGRPYQLPSGLLPLMLGWLLLTLFADTLFPGLSGTAHGAHIGGLIFGLAAAVLWPLRPSQEANP